MLTRLLKIHLGRGQAKAAAEPELEVVFPYQRPGSWLGIVINMPRFRLLGQLMKEEGREGRKENLEREGFSPLSHIPLRSRYSEH